MEKSKYAALYLLFKLGLNLNKLRFEYIGDGLALETPIGQIIFEFGGVEWIGPGDRHMDWDLSINFTAREGEWEYILNTDAHGYGYTEDDVEWTTIDGLYDLTRTSLADA